MITDKCDVRVLQGDPEKSSAVAVINENLIMSEVITYILELNFDEDARSILNEKLHDAVAEDSNLEKILNMKSLEFFQRVGEENMHQFLRSLGDFKENRELYKKLCSMI